MWLIIPQGLGYRMHVCLLPRIKYYFRSTTFQLSKAKKGEKNMALVIPALVGAGLYRIYNRKNATLKEIDDYDKDGCKKLNEGADPNNPNVWVPFQGGLLRRTPKCAKCPKGTRAVQLHRIGNNECVGGSDSRRKKTSKRGKRKKGRNGGGGGGCSLNA